MRTPDPRCSLRFLRGLQSSDYISPAGTEYRAEDVDNLINEKLAAYDPAAESRRYYRQHYYDDEGGGNAVKKPQPPPKLRPRREKPKEPPQKVISLRHARDERNRRNVSFKCSECGYSTRDLDDFSIGTETVREHFGNSGRFVCPECDSVQDDSVFDHLVEIDKHGVSAMIPHESLAEVEAVLADSDSNAAFNLGVAMMQPIRHELLAQYPNLARLLFPFD